MVTEAIYLEADAKARRGFLLALAAYLLWGLLPFYMKAVAHLPLAEVIAHRIVWSVPIAAAVLVWAGRTADFKAALRSRRTISMAVLTAALISINWGIYVWAISVDRTVETALGYYINPLVVVVVGALLLGERLGPAADRGGGAGGGSGSGADGRGRQAALGVAGAGLFLCRLRLLPQDAADRPEPGLSARSAFAVGSGARLHRLPDRDRTGSFRLRFLERHRTVDRLRSGHRGAAAALCLRGETACACPQSASCNTSRRPLCS